jgi:hypothetical protein
MGEEYQPAIVLIGHNLPNSLFLGMLTNIIYEVNLEIQIDTLLQFRKWLTEKHIDDMLKFKGFKTADLLELESAKEGVGSLCCQYHVESREDLEDYFKNHAAAMRQEGIDLFGQRFTASRRILKKLKKF